MSQERQNNFSTAQPVVFESDWQIHKINIPSEELEAIIVSVEAKLQEVEAAVNTSKVTADVLAGYLDGSARSVFMEGQEQLVSLFHETSALITGVCQELNTLIQVDDYEGCERVWGVCSGAEAMNNPI